MHYMNDVYELAMVVCGLNPNDDKDFEVAEDKIEDLLYEKFEISEEAFENLVKALAKFTPPLEAGISKEKYHGFVDVEKSMFLYKQKA